MGKAYLRRTSRTIALNQMFSEHVKKNKNGSDEVKPLPGKQKKLTP